MTMPYYRAPVGTSRPITQYYPNSTISMNLVQQFQQNSSTLRPPYQDIYSSPAAAAAPSHGYASFSKHYIPKYSMVAPNAYAVQPPIGYQGLTLPFVHIPNVIYPNLAVPLPNQNYLPPAQSYVSQLKSAANRIAATDALVISDSTSLSEAKSVPQKNSWRDVVITGNTGAPERESTRGYEQPSLADLSLGQSHVFGGAYEQGPGQTYISKIRSITEGIPFDDPRFYIPYPKRPRPTPNSASPLPDSQGEPPVERKKRRNPSKNPSSDSKPKKRRSTCNSPPTHQLPDNEPLASNEDKTQEYDLAYFSKNPRSNWYPRPVSTNCEYLYLGSNSTTVPTSVYTRITWKSVENSTRILMESIFNEGSLATHSMDPSKVQDVVTLVAEKCVVNEDAVRTAIRKICADASLKSKGFS